jgi:hypothetical protein
LVSYFIDEKSQAVRTEGPAQGHGSRNSGANADLIKNLHSFYGGSEKANSFLLKLLPNSKQGKENKRAV